MAGRDYKTIGNETTDKIYELLKDCYAKNLKQDATNTAFSIILKPFDRNKINQLITKCRDEFGYKYGNLVHDANNEFSKLVEYSKKYDTERYKFNCEINGEKKDYSADDILNHLHGKTNRFKNYDNTYADTKDGLAASKGQVMGMVSDIVNYSDVENEINEAINLSKRLRSSHNIFQKGRMWISKKMYQRTSKKRVEQSNKNNPSGVQVANPETGKFISKEENDRQIQEKQEKRKKREAYIIDNVLFSGNDDVPSSSSLEQRNKYGERKESKTPSQKTINDAEYVKHLLYMQKLHPVDGPSKKNKGKAPEVSFDEQHTRNDIAADNDRFRNIKKKSTFADLKDQASSSSKPALGQDKQPEELKIPPRTSSKNRQPIPPVPKINYDDLLNQIDGLLKSFKAYDPPRTDSLKYSQENPAASDKNQRPLSSPPTPERGASMGRHPEINNLKRRP